jgi:hypothetical protein
VLYPAYLALEALCGRGLAAAMDFGGDYEARLPPLFITLLGYVAMMTTYVARGTFRDLQALRPVLQGGEAAYAELRQQLIQFESRRLWIGALVWLAFGCVLAELGGGAWTGLLAGEWSLRDLCETAVGFPFWMLIGRAAVYLIDSARLYSRIGEQQVALDLLDLRPLLPLTHHGLRIVLFLALSTAASGIVGIVGDPSGASSRMLAVFLGCLADVVLASAAFVLPILGLRRQIRTRKAEELARVREEIHRDRELVAKLGAESIEAGGRLPGLLAYSKTIESVREWPFDAPTLTRFFLYVAIPLGSWLGGALAERLLGAALD